MKKYLFALTALITFCSCSHNGSDESSIADSTNVRGKDNVADKDTNLFLSPDLRLYDLRGDVKKAEITIYDSDNTGAKKVERHITSSEFDRNGVLTANENTALSNDNFIRDRDGRLKTLVYHYNAGGGDGSYCEEEYSYLYNADGSLAKTEKSFVGEICGGLCFIYQYNNEGELESFTTSGVSDGVGVEANTDVKILERDVRGNWTRRLLKEVCTTTEEYGDEGQTDVSTTTEYTLQIRKIEYYE